jgi:hypothetical protein
MGSQKRRALHVNYRIAQTHPISGRDNGQTTVEPEFNGDDLRNVDLKVFGVSVTLNISLRSVHPRSCHANASANRCWHLQCVWLLGRGPPITLLRGRKPKQPTRFALAPRRKRELAHSALGM